MEITTGTGIWFHGGLPVVPLRWVLRDPTGKLDPKALLCTDLELAPVEVVRYFVRRWTIEVTFAEVRRHLGVETQRQWSNLAIARTTPCLLGLFSIVTLIADRLQELSGIPVHQIAWYQKPAPTFSDALALVRRHLWRDRAFSISAPVAEVVKVPQAAWGRLTDVLARAT